ncbi:hypothetical protein MTR67_016248, partial [Solanum verrucosum]
RATHPRPTLQVAPPRSTATATATAQTGGSSSAWLAAAIGGRQQREYTSGGLGLTPSCNIGEGGIALAEAVQSGRFSS